MILETVAIFYSNIHVLYYFMAAFAVFEILFQKNWKSVLWIGFILLILQYSLLPLKNFFQVPSIHNPALYGFPSGHIYWFTALYGWACFRLSQTIEGSQLSAKSALKGFVIAKYVFIMALIGYYTVDHGYHTWNDVAGGLAFGSLLLMVPIVLVQRAPSLISSGCNFCSKFK